MKIPKQSISKPHRNLTVEQKFLLPIAHSPLVCLVEVLGQHNISILPHSLQSSLSTNGCHICATNLFAPVDIILQIQLITQVHLGRGSLEHHPLLSPIGLGELNLPIQSSWSQQCRIECIRPIRSHDNLDIGSLIEPIHLIQQLQQDTLHLTIGPSLGIETFGGNGINFINKDNTGGVFSGETKDITNHAGSFSEVLLDEFRTDHGDEGGGGGVGDCFGHHGFTSPRRPIKQHPPRRIDSNLCIQMMLNQGQLNRLPHLLLLNIHPPNILITHIGLLAHQLHRRITLGWQNIHHRMRMTMQRNRRIGLQRLPIQRTQYPHIVITPSRRTNNPIIGIDHFVKLPNDQGDRLDPADFFLGPEEFPLEVAHFVLEVFFLKFDEF
mmetsp:Transcript_13011/g.21320  ORF Transcript_13011/g.21320 Transcript_13011/m.21320 type:complete len:381 (+) Transcript_13011:45-1187(+)